MLFLYALGLYRRDALLETRKSLGRVPIAAGLGGLVGSAAGYLLPPPFATAGTATLFASAVLGLVPLGWIARIILFALLERGAFRRRLMIIGAGQRAWDMVWLLRREGRTLGFDITFVHDPSMGEIDPRLSEDPANRIVPASRGFRTVAQEIGADLIVVAPDERRGMKMDALLACRTAGFPVFEYHRFLEKEIGRVDVKRLDYGWLLYSDGFTFPPAAYPTRIRSPCRVPSPGTGFDSTESSLRSRSGATNPMASFSRKRCIG